MSSKVRSDDYQNKVKKTKPTEEKKIKKSFRAQAEEFSTKKKLSSKRKNIQEIDNLNTIQQKDEEDANKRQGWWNQ